MRQKKLVIGLLIMLAVLVSGSTYAYWFSVAGDDVASTGTVTIGTGKDFTTTVTVGAQTGQSLVPSGMVDFSNEADATDSVVLNFVVNWDEDTTSALTTETGTIGVTITNIKVDGVTTYSSSISVTQTTVPGITINDTATVVITVTMAEPADFTEYTAVAGKDITFDITFDVTVD